MAQLLSPFFAGAVFGAGLVLSGMTRTSKVLGFLDLSGGAWDPSLAAVMGGALLVYGLTQGRVRRRERPLLAALFSVPEHRDLDARLLTGAAIFGVGWGLVGYCPGPALTSLLSSASSWWFVLSMTFGMWLYSLLPVSGVKSAKAPLPDVAEPPERSSHDTTFGTDG